MSRSTTPQSRHTRSANHGQQVGRHAGDVQEAINSRAYEICQARQRNGTAGDQLSDWLEAEGEIKKLSRGDVLMRGDQD